MERPEARNIRELSAIAQRVGCVKAVFDTNILIDYLLGNISARTAIQQYKEPQISVITKMEVLVGTSSDTEKIVRAFLEHFTLISLSEEIAEIAVALRKEHKIKLPDAIIWATARHSDSVLVTRNIKDFSPKTLGIKIPYKID